MQYLGGRLLRNSRSGRAGDMGLDIDAAWRQVDIVEPRPPVHLQCMCRETTSSKDNTYRDEKANLFNPTSVLVTSSSIVR